VNISCFVEVAKAKHHSSNVLAVGGRLLSHSTLRFLHNPIGVDRNINLAWYSISHIGIRNSSTTFTNQSISNADTF